MIKKNISRKTNITALRREKTVMPYSIKKVTDQTANLRSLTRAIGLLESIRVNLFFQTVKIITILFRIKHTKFRFFGDLERTY